MPRKAFLLVVCMLFLILAWLAIAQNPETSSWPPTAATDTDLLVLANSAQTTLNGGINNSTLTIVLTDASAFATPTAIKIQNEYIKICSKSSNTLTACSSGRGQYGSSAASHSSGEVVSGYFVAYITNKLAAEVKALQAGAVAGPASATDGEIVIYNGSTGKLVKISGVFISATGGISIGTGTNSCDGSAGCIQLGQGTAPSGQATNGVQIVVPTGVTSWRLVLPGSSSTGFLKGTNALNINTWSFVSQLAISTDISGLGSNIATALGTPTFTNWSTAMTGDTLAGSASTNVWTNKTYNVESTGNVFTAPAVIVLWAGGCQNTTAISFWDLPTSTPAVATCVTGTNIQKGVLAYADTSGGFSAQTSISLPADWTSGTAPDVDIYWTSSATSGNAKWTVQFVCTDVAASATDDPAFPTSSNGFNTVTTAAPGTANRVQTSTITAATVPASCVTATRELFHVRVFRDGNDGSDTLSATANFLGLALTVRRAM